MARPVRFSPVSRPTSSQSTANDRPSARLVQDGRSRPAVEAGHGRGIDERQSRDKPPSPTSDEVPFDSAIEAMLAAGGVDPVTRIRLSEAQKAIAQDTADRALTGMAETGLHDVLFRFVMPRLRHPEVLRADRQRTLLEGLADDLDSVSDDGVAQYGALIIHRELHRLGLLRTTRNSLIQG